jgi:AraC-like DNA-binding protein
MILQACSDVMKDIPIDALWVVDISGISEEKRMDTIIPIGQLHIVYNFADPYELVVDGNYKQIPNQVLVGQLKEPAKIRYGNTIKQLGIAIKPASFYRLFGQVASLYSEIVIDFSHLSFFSELHRHVEATMSDIDLPPLQQLEQIASYFRGKKFMETDAMDIDEMIQYIENHTGGIDIKEMAKHFHYSVSSLERNFKKYMGLPPKAYVDIIRFQKAVLEDNPERLFYDQSHYIKNCKKYTTKIPARLKESKEISVRHMLGLESADFIQ